MPEDDIGTMSGCLYSFPMTLDGLSSKSSSVGDLA